MQARGKQCPDYHSRQADYTRTTGIWQTVWLECVPRNYISGLKYIPNPENGCLHIEGSFIGKVDGYVFSAEATFGSKNAGSGRAVVSGQNVQLTLPLTEIHLWEPGVPNLYDLEIRLLDGNDCVDRLSSYFGLRSVKLTDNETLINGKPVFQRLVLDQGYYPDGIYTAPSDDALKNDIEIGIGLGFNGARLHQKIFEPRFMYWADKLGYLVWGEHGSRGLDITKPSGLQRMLPEWMEIVERDFNSPALVGWCPFNETWDVKAGPSRIAQDDEIIRIVYNVTKSMDRTRPVIEDSGNYHVVTDIFDIHDYEQDVEKFAARYKGLTDCLLDNPRMCAICYTQLYDVEQEVNGLYTYDRKPKFDPEIIRKINVRKAAIEK